jgi:hypothetical protein
MPDIPVPVEIEFADFIARLITETSEAVIAAQSEQEYRYSEITATATLDAGEFAARYITDQEVDEELAQLFPSNQPDQPHAIFVGAPYKPGATGVNESPNLTAALGLTPEHADLHTARAGQPATLTASAVSKIRHATRLRLATAHLAILRKTVARGFPLVAVDSGRINAKVSLELVRATSAAPPSRVARLVALLKQLARLAAQPAPHEQQNFRVVVRMADARLPQAQKLQVNVFGEVEITFKTIT